MSDVPARLAPFATRADAPVSPAELDAAYAEIAAELAEQEQAAAQLEQAMNAGQYAQLGAYSQALQKRAGLQATLHKIDALRGPQLTHLEQAAAEWAGLTPAQYAALKGSRS